MRVIVSLLLIIGLAPGAGEVLETLAGVEHVAPVDGTTDRDEHGCTALLHVCGCHVATHGALTAPAVAAPRSTSIAFTLFDVDDHQGRAAAPPGLRPPIA